MKKAALNVKLYWPSSLKKSQFGVFFSSYKVKSKLKMAFFEMLSTMFFHVFQCWNQNMISVKILIY